LCRPPSIEHLIDETEHLRIDELLIRENVLRQLLDHFPRSAFAIVDDLDAQSVLSHRVPS
jgi:hypothetical protein